MKIVSIDVASDRTAFQIADELPAANAHPEPTRVVLRVLSPSGARKLVAKIFGAGKEHPSRAARGSALVARGYREIAARIDAAGDDVVTGESV